MGKVVNYDVLDGAFAVLKGATRMIASAAQPVATDYAGTVAARLSEASMAVGDYLSANETAANGGGRKITVAAKSGANVIAAGTAAFVSLLDATRILYTTTCPAQMLATGGTVSFGAWDIVIGDPA